MRGFGSRLRDRGRSLAIGMAIRRLLSSPPKNGSTHMGGAFFVAKSCEDLGGSRAKSTTDGSSRHSLGMPYSRMQATVPLVSDRDSHLFPSLRIRNLPSVTSLK